MFQVSRVSLIVAGSLRSRLHSVGTRWQNSIQAGVGLATAVVGSCRAVGKAAILRVPISRAGALLINHRRAAQATKLKPRTRHNSGPTCARSTPSIAPAHAFGNDPLT